MILVQLNEKFGELASDERIKKTASALKENGFEVEVVENKEEVKRKVLEMIPEGSEVFTMSSQTLEQVSLSDAINNSGKYNSVRNKLFTMDRNTQAREMARLGAAPDWVVSSVHAVTEDGHLIIASNTGSQLSAEAYAGGKVIFVVGVQKIVKDNQEGIKRIYEYCLPLEDERARKAYGMGSNVSKILIINKEIFPERITVFLVKEKLGF
ncbi:MAG: LUD domain-containing protein [Candidatus Woesebacteria bacterium]|nr:MAG: LUD domain-containing protein [Candidatus Woesebacteria bacterium]